jgi:anti-sigma-K factor RskA
MNYERAELREQLAGAYVVGTLRGLARLRFARACAGSRNLRAAVHRWEGQLLSLLASVAPEIPRAAVGKIILRRTTGSFAARSRKLSWRWALTGVLALSLVLVTGVRVLYSPPQMPGALRPDRMHPLWAVSRSADCNILKVRALHNVRSDPRSAYELWALAANGSAPVSLGLLPRSGGIERRLSTVQRRGLLRSGRIAVSREPQGGSPTGSPTGPILVLSQALQLN